MHYDYLFDYPILMPSYILFYLLAAATYTGLAAWMWRLLVQHQGPIGQLSAGFKGALLVALILHGLALGQSILLPQGLFLGWAVGLSTAIWLAMVVFWIESFFLSLNSYLLALLPLSAVACLFSLFFPQGSYVVAAHNDWVQGHLIIALISYGLMAVAAVYALLVLFFERYLHQPATEQRKRPVLYLALESMPPLLTQEKLLFHFIRFGFAALTLAMVSGSFVSAMLTQQWFPLDHKTVFTVLSWLTFGALLVGRRLYGWRGRAAVRATLLGFILLLLAYSGSHFVLDVLLKRGSIG